MVDAERSEFSRLHDMQTIFETLKRCMSELDRLDAAFACARLAHAIDELEMFIREERVSASSD